MRGVFLKELIRYSWFFLGCLFFLWNQNVVIADDDESLPPPTDPIVAMVAERMQILSNGLGKMPVPPVMDQKLEIPGLDFMESHRSHSGKKES